MRDDVLAAVIIATAVLVSGVVVRAVGRWFNRSVTRDFTAAVQAAVKDDLHELSSSIASMRQEQTEQHGQVRQDVAHLGLQMDVVGKRLDRIETRIYPPTEEP